MNSPNLAATIIPSAPPPGRMPRWPRGFLGMLVGIVAVELFIAGRPKDYTTVTAEDWRLTGLAATAQAPGRDLLCFGDSLIKYGIFPRVIEAKTGLTGYNLALNSGPLPAGYFLLRRALAAGAHPKAIVADFFPLMLPDRPREPVRMYAELASWADCVDLARTAGDGNLGASLALHKLIPSVRCRFEIRRSVRAAFDGKRASPWPREWYMWASWKREQGAQPMGATPPGKSAANPDLVAGLTFDRWAIDPINAAYFERFVSLAEAHDIPVFWVIPPLGPEIEAGRAALGTAALYSQFALKAQARHPNLIVLDARRAGYDMGSHIDPIHLNEGGATTLSGDIGALIAAHLGGRLGVPWADLPPYAGRGVGRSPVTEVAGRASRPAR